MAHNFDAYNAKHLKSEDVARSFVSSKLFLETAKNEHTILVGPRGSGKTTFLRMLSINTLPKWEGAGQLEVDYQGIYVPGDLVWGEMIKSLEDVGLKPGQSESFSYSAFFIHVLLNTIESIEHSIEQVEKVLIEDRQVQIREALNEICQILKLKPERISLSRIRHELVLKFNELGEFSRQISVTGCVPNDSKEFDIKVPYAYLDLKSTIESVLFAIDRALNRPEHRWALLLDEFEIAPKYLLDKVISSMRSSAKKVYFKVALVPCGFHQEIKRETSSINDYSIVELWYSKKGESNEFCQNLIKSRLGLSNPVERLGTTKFGSRFSSNHTKWIGEFDSLIEKDKTFKSFVLSKNINYKEEFTSKNRVSNLVRKISPVVAFRNAFLNSNGTRKGRSSLPEFYTGWEAISTISEGNPRWLLAILSPLLSDGSDRKVSESDQMAKVSGASNAYAAMLKTLPLSNNMGLTTREPIFELLSNIGGFFNSRLIDDHFQSNTSSTFVVDRDINKDIESALMIAWNYGAIVSVDSENTFGTYDSLEYMRFRLSHMLAPKLKLNLTTGSRINLSTILNPKPKRPKSLSLFDGFSNQQDLF